MLQQYTSSEIIYKGRGLFSSLFRRLKAQVHQSEILWGLTVGGITMKGTLGNLGDYGMGLLIYNKAMSQQLSPSGDQYTPFHDSVATLLRT